MMVGSTASIRLLLNSTAVRTANLWHSTLRSGLVLADWADPHFSPRLGSTITEEESRARDFIASAGEQLRNVGLVAAAGEILNSNISPTTKVMLLAATCSTPWVWLGGNKRSEIHARPSADGGRYLMRVTSNTDISPAPDSYAVTASMLWLLPASDNNVEPGPSEGEALARAQGRSCASLAAALRDAEIMLRDLGATTLAAQVHALMHPSDDEATASGQSA